MLFFSRFIAFAVFSVTSLASADEAASMFRYPDIHNDQIVFVYANDLWRVDAEGGTALPLASPAGTELMPRFSPDGSHVAFVGNYDGNRDIYTVPLLGGMPNRVTHHPTTELLSDWTTDDQLLFSARGMGGVPKAERPFSVSSKGGQPEPFAVPYGAHATIDRTGTWLAFTPMQRDRRTWKRYMGGMASDIWLVNLMTGESRRVTDFGGTDTMPMWHGQTLYYLSDAGDGHRLNLFSYDLASGEHEQETFFKDFDVKWPSIGPDNDAPAQIVFQLGSGIFVFDGKTGGTRRVEIAVPGATSTIRTHMVDASDFINDWNISPTGKRAVVEARGDIWTLPAENGSPRNLSRTDGTAERAPAWSPDGRWIAYFSDETGEYELFIRPSDGSGEPKQLTDDGGPFKLAIEWAPNSEWLLFSDKTGAAWRLALPDDEEDPAEPTLIAKNPWGTFPSPSISHDSRWIAFAMGTEESSQGRVHLHDTTTGETNRVTDSMFHDSAVTFDREGDWLYFASSRRFVPTYSHIDTTWIYEDGDRIMAVGLRDDVEFPWLETSDEEDWKDKEEEEEEEEAENNDDEDEQESGDEDTQKDVDEDEQDGVDENDPVTGRWSCIAELSSGQTLDVTLRLKLHADNSVTGSLSSAMFDGDLNGTFNPEDWTIELTIQVPNGPTVTIQGSIDDDGLIGTAGPDGEKPTPFSGTLDWNDDEDDDSDKANDEKEENGDDTFDIDLENFERRAIQLPIAPGSFRNLSANSKNQLLYVRSGKNGGIKVFDLSDEDASEQSGGSGGGFIISADGKKMLVGSTIRKAGTGSGGDPVIKSPMFAPITPREEWKQLVTDAWRIQRDFFYDPNMHGVDWDAKLAAYLPLVDHAATREDVSYIIGELIGELNVGHAYYYGGDGEDTSSMNVGMLGVDWEAVDANEANGTPAGYRIARIIEGAEWDTDARNPLNRRGLDIEEGDIVTAVNGIPMDPTRDPYAAFVGLAGKPVVLTIAARPQVEDDSEHDVVVRTLRDENELRYRNWIESRRSLVDEMTDGKVGYIYVPNTGRDGQSDLVRQFYGQAHKPSLIIDERWNGGGQIPTRFIELLNRPVTNYWARRDAVDWKWPPDSHQGPMAMLINGRAGSGGDMFPWLFRNAGLGPIIGTRTWGGLVGISGNPGLIDGGYTAVPTFGFYETDGTWGIEGHGVDPDVEVLDDPGEMLEGQDPQLNMAIKMMLEALANGEGPQTPTRPAPPRRGGMGVSDADK